MLTRFTLVNVLIENSWNRSLLLNFGFIDEISNTVRYLEIKTRADPRYGSVKIRVGPETSGAHSKYKKVFVDYSIFSQIFTNKKIV